MTPTQRVYCDSYNCSYGYTHVYNAKDVKCWFRLCRRSKCCEKACSSYDCPYDSEHIHNADITVCQDSKCTTEKCCDFNCELCSPLELAKRLLKC